MNFEHRTVPQALYPVMIRSLSTGSRIALAIAITFTAALPGVLVAPELDGWFAELQRPTFAPPNGVFGPVWTVLYLLMGTAAGLVWARVKLTPVRNALLLYGAQLLLNALWTVVFFGLHSPHGALVVILLLLLFIVLTIRAFLPINRTAGRLLLPYLLWVAFATVLNAGYVYLN